MRENAIKHALIAALLPVKSVMEDSLPTGVTGCLIYYSGPAKPAAAKEALRAIRGIKEVVQRQPDIHFAVYDSDVPQSMTPPPRPIESPSTYPAPRWSTTRKRYRSLHAAAPEYRRAGVAPDSANDLNRAVELPRGRAAATPSPNASDHNRTARTKLPPAARTTRLPTAARETELPSAARHPQVPYMTGCLSSTITVRLTTGDAEFCIKNVHIDHFQIRIQNREEANNARLPASSPRMAWHIEAHGLDLICVEFLSGDHADFRLGFPNLPVIVDELVDLPDFRCPDFPLLRVDQR